MIVVTGATGQLGRLTITALLKTTPANQIIAAVRSPEKAANLAALGVQVRAADYNNPASLATAFAGATKLLLISSNDLAHRIPQQKAVIDAAKVAGVQLLAYTSILRCDTSTLALAQDHKITEEYLRASGIPFVFLRNGWYLENRTATLGAALTHGAIIGAAGEGRFASAARADYAEAAAAVLTTEGHANKIYELNGDTSFTLSELATEVTRQSGKQVVYTDLPAEALTAAYISFGLPAEFVSLLVDSDLKAANGELDSTSTDLRNLIGHPTTTMAEAVAAALPQ